MNGYDFSDLMELVAENKLSQMYTCLPCKVKTFDKAEQKVEVDILVKLRRPYQEEEQIFQSIAEIPVGFYNSDDGNCFMTFPIKVGDLGIVLFSTLDLDNYLSGDAGAAVNSASFGRGQLKDAMFLPMFRPWKKALSGLADDDLIMHNNKLNVAYKKTGDLEIINDAMTFTVRNDGKLQLSNGANELIAVLDELLTKLLSATVVTMLGASPFTASTIAELTAIQVKLQTFKV